MKRYFPYIAAILVLALVQMACNLPNTLVSDTDATPNPNVTATITLPAIYTATAADFVTATPWPTATQAQPTQAAAPTATNRPAATSPSTNLCSYRATFVADISIPDDTQIDAGKTFVKTWRVRNDGTCTWGANYPLHSLIYTGGSKLTSTTQVVLPASVPPGQSVDISINMVAPNNPGTYVSEWMFRVDGDPAGRGPYIGLGANGTGTLFTRIKVPGSSPIVSRVTFATGATQAEINDTLAANQTRGYVVNALKDQVIIASAASASGQVKVKITAANGAALNSSANNNTSNAQTYLPSTQDYTVWVTAGSQNTTFKLAILIPARISFDPGATSATRTGKVTNLVGVTYILRASAGQTMSVQMTGDMGLGIYGFNDGQVLKHSAVGNATYSGVLPATQDYIILVDPRGVTSDYTLKVTVVSGQTAPTATATVKPTATEDPYPGPDPYPYP